MTTIKMRKSLQDFLGIQATQGLSIFLHNSFEITLIDMSLKNRLIEIGTPRVWTALVVFLEGRLEYTSSDAANPNSEPKRQLEHGLERLLGELESLDPGWLAKLTDHIRREGHTPNLEQIIHRLGHNGFKPHPPTAA